MPQWLLYHAPHGRSSLRHRMAWYYESVQDSSVLFNRSSQGIISVPSDLLTEIFPWQQGLSGQVCLGHRPNRQYIAQPSTKKSLGR